GGTCGGGGFLSGDPPPGTGAGRPCAVEARGPPPDPARRVPEPAPAARTTMQSPLRWRDDASWKLDFSNLDRMTPEQIAERRREFDEIKAIARSKREAT